MLVVPNQLFVHTLNKWHLWINFFSHTSYSIKLFWELWLLCASHSIKDLNLCSVLNKTVDHYFPVNDLRVYWVHVLTSCSPYHVKAISAIWTYALCLQLFYSQWMQHEMKRVQGQHNKSGQWNNEQFPELMCNWCALWYCRQIICDSFLSTLISQILNFKSDWMFAVMPGYFANCFMGWCWPLTDILVYILSSSIWKLLFLQIIMEKNIL